MDIPYWSTALFCHTTNQFTNRTTQHLYNTLIYDDTFLCPIQLSNFASVHVTNCMACSMHFNVDDEGYYCKYHMQPINVIALLQRTHNLYASFALYEQFAICQIELVEHCIVAAYAAAFAYQPVIKSSVCHRDFSGLLLLLLDAAGCCWILFVACAMHSVHCATFIQSVMCTQWDAFGIPPWRFAISCIKRCGMDLFSLCLCAAGCWLLVTGALYSAVAGAHATRIDRDMLALP